MIVAVILTVILYFLMLGSSVWLVISTIRSRDYDCALGGVFLTLMVLIVGSLFCAAVG